LKGLSATATAVRAEDSVSVPTTVVINEMMADNKAIVESTYGNFPDWVELFNSGSEAVDLSGMYLTDDPAQPTWQFPAGTIIEPNGYRVVWADGDSELGSLHASFKLNANGETVALLAVDGKTVVDSVTFGKQIEDVSYGRLPDGRSSWYYLTNPTPGDANVANSRGSLLTFWPFWLAIGLTLVACVLVILQDHLRAWRRM
jgi:hypothetical protein